MEDLDILEDATVDQGEAHDVLGLPQVALQAIAEVHQVVFGGVDLPESGAEGTASSLEGGLLAAPLFLQTHLLLLHVTRPTQLGTLVCIFRPESLRLLPQELEEERDDETAQARGWARQAQTDLYLLESGV